MEYWPHPDVTARAVAVALNRPRASVQVKSPNILLTGSNKPYAKLADLGLARMPAVYAASMMDDTLKGTFAWLAPEMILNNMNHEVGGALQSSIA